ncbi:amino acid ABC transporter permease [Amycolatopsis regifaucium]|uniref:Amino acid ABC transporter permease n=1 Tax=Amycolatopsis regifaucium TaxID=546365 RepID=A0A154MKN8_9PSEU|nr:amino acid ABC transporter permease [Amycolatopsis regifaucium]KZB84573.1 amino acid ABC transporter permease [Amycolatopsis regifaucium]OKA11036.1 amino acid ABC transporter permease [Amycolatopsis regifaucium]SFI26376.1 glutamate transport system permease protein [Amycolatopsis regifaucium]
MSAQTVLYDIPGPKARARNWLYSVLFVLVLALVVYFIYAGFDEKNQWAGALWEPFLKGSTWTEFILPGLLNTLKAAALSIVIALPIGALLGIGRLSDHKWVRIPVGAVVEFFRAIPVLLLMVFAAAFYAFYTDIDAEIRPLFAAVTGLVLYNGSVMAEVFRAGILSLPKGQGEAASALGMRKTQIMMTVLLPQAVTLMLPALVSQLVVILKDTALAGQLTIGFNELIRSTGPLTGLYGNTIPTLIVVAIIFIVLNLLLSWFASWLENKLARRKKAPKGAKPVHDAPASVVDATDFNTGRSV